jgi:hypothetical protein
MKTKVKVIDESRQLFLKRRHTTQTTPILTVLKAKCEALIAVCMLLTMIFFDLPISRFPLLFPLFFEGSSEWGQLSNKLLIQVKPIQKPK